MFIVHHRTTTHPMLALGARQSFAALLCCHFSSKVIPTNEPMPCLCGFAGGGEDSGPTNLNMLSALAHVAADTLRSVAVMVRALLASSGLPAAATLHVCFAAHLQENDSG